MDDEGFEVQSLINDLVYDAGRDKKLVRDPKILTKSKFLNGIQCPKLLWTRCNAPETIPAPSNRLQQVFDIGHRVGELATTRFPGGQRISEDNFQKNIEDTRTLLSSQDPKPIYEAGVKAGRLYSRADILVPSVTLRGMWDVVEVKCSTSVKEVYLQDIAFQRYCYEQAGISVDRCYLMHINNQYVRQGDIEAGAFFTLVDVTEELVPFIARMPGWIDGFLKIIDMPVCPHIGIREHCGKPYECPMKPGCWAFLPEAHVVELTRGKSKGFDLIDQGILRLAEIPDDYKLTDNQTIQRYGALTGQPYVDQGALGNFLKGLKYPLWYMDFETIFEAIPRFNGIRPYQQVPFQFSVHRQSSPEAVPEHFEFLHQASDDPRLYFLHALKLCLGLDGTILAYNMSFEKARLKELGDAFPEYADWCREINMRMDDLIIPFRSFIYYHPAQHGSASLKKVLPALTGKSYVGMAIADGGQATGEYVRVTYGAGIDPTDRARVYADLEAYCGLDTAAMVDILSKLMGMIEDKGVF